MAKKKEAPAKKSAPSPEPRVRFRPRLWISLLLLCAAGIVGNRIWHHYAPAIAQHQQYRLTAEDIILPPTPTWIRSDIRQEALHAAGLSDSLSILDDWGKLCDQISTAFRVHPWVLSVGEMRRSLPSSLHVDLTYRRPVAAIESVDSSGPSYLPIDIHAVRLPEKDMDPVEIAYLPRISGIGGRPVVGDHWRDPRVTEGAKLAAALADVWQDLRLVELIPVRPIVRGGEPHQTFEITTNGGTRIVWGVAPGQEEAVGESSFADKRARLLQFSAEFRTIDGPELVDVRSELIVTPRSARKKLAAPNTSTR